MNKIAEKLPKGTDLFGNFLMVFGTGLIYQ